MSQAAISVSSLSKSFGGIRAIDDVSLSVAPGERRVLIGPNGAGKTTLFHCITGTLQATTGTVSMFGTDVTRLGEARRTELGMGRTFQISNVFTDLTVIDNVILALLGKDRRKWVAYRPVDAYPELREQAAESLEMVGLPHRANDSVARLSYGERRQLELALAMKTGPRVLFLDEPCAGLSPSERQHFARMIAALPRHLTLLMIEHDMDVALALADRVTVLHRGKVIIEGDPDTVQSDSEVREVYFGHA
ncbi:ABC transporter ATP-binding protein [Zeimonas arvi]|uniref:ABC transporter ATP-binding protein n=1 Tax=Zeimonas arvi TaxID=2498847 RepID=A0A5C8NYN8_9BURK|nr:ABC transporter ATP-binding protein [Zeimonas arvi]TXL66202.1 ABC transporter ATP-binding protein [Zeimonas arvi]